MQHILSDIPQELDDRFTRLHGNWRAKVEVECPTIRTAFAFAARQGLKFQYGKVGFGWSREMFKRMCAYADFPKGIVAVSYDDKETLGEFLAKPVHEIKHFMQYFTEPRLYSVFEAVNTPKSPGQPRPMRLPTLAQYMLMTLSSEYDAEHFDKAATLEVTRCLTRQVPPQKPEKLWNCDRHLDDCENEIGRLMGVVTFLARRSPPAVTISPISKSDILKMTEGMWRECNMQPAVRPASEGGKLERIEEVILSSPQYKRASAKYDRWLSRSHVAYN